MRITLPSGTPAEIARPSGEPVAGLVLIPDIGGLRPLFDEHCARIASEWNVAVCAPEPFPGDESFSIEQRMAHMAQRDDARALGDIEAAADELGTPAVHVLGFCQGGMYALKAAAGTRFAKAVSFYGMIRIPSQWKGSGQGEPLEVLRARGDASRVLALIGTEDPWVSVDDGEELRKLGADVVVYEGAEHGFAHDPSRPAHRPDDAADAWSRAKAFLLG